MVTGFVELGLIDELGVSIIPVLLGGGIPFFGSISQWTKLELLECRQYQSGIVLLNYRLKAKTTITPHVRKTGTNTTESAVGT